MLFEPIYIGKLKLKNRMVLAPMGVTIGNMTAGTVDYFAERAKGGAAMIFCNIKGSASFESAAHSIYFNKETEQLFRETVARCHGYGCMVGAQIMPGDGRIGGASTKYKVPICASAVPWMHVPKLLCHELTADEIGQIERDYRESVRAALRCGADCIEIHAYGGYLTDQFLTARWNIRTDAYGGSLENRTRFLKELIDICKEEGGKDYPVIVKFTPEHYMDGEGYRHMEEGLALAKLLVSYGADGLHVDAGCHDNWYHAMPPAALQEPLQMQSAAAVKAAVDVPVLTNGRLGDAAKAEAALRDGVCDVAVIGRGLLADPYLPKKLEEGHTEDIVPCIACNEGCIGRVFAGKPATCAVNPRCGFEDGSRDIPKTDTPKRIVIVGGGVGGCMAAIYAHDAGHQVVVLEQSDHIGGSGLTASKPYFKRSMQKLVDYFETQLRKRSIPVYFHTQGDEKNISAHSPDHIIWAAGGVHKQPNLAGLNCEHVYRATDALMGSCPVGQRVVVVGGGMAGTETALHLARLGHTVTAVARAFPARAGFKMNDDLLRKMMEESSVHFMKDSRLQSIRREGERCIVTVAAGEMQQELVCDTVLLALGYDPSAEQAEAFSHIAPVTVIGDACKAGKIIDAVHGAWEAVRSIK